MKKQTFIPSALFLLWLLIVALACNLTDSSPPPTIVPRATSTPPPTIGYATLSPDELPDAVSTVPRAEEPTGPLVGPRSDVVLLNLMNQIDSNRLMEHVSALQNMYTRHVLSSQNNPNQGIGGATNYILSQFNAIRDASRGAFVVLPPHQFKAGFAGTQINAQNVVGLIQGTETGGGILLIGAHYDSITIGAGWENGNAYAPGANDNGSGVAALIEIARVMSSRPHRSTVMFVAFGAEEIGRQGSIAFVNEYLRPNGINIDYMINLDLIGSSTGPNGEIEDRKLRIYSADPNNSASRQLARAINLIAFNHVPGMEVVVRGSGDREGRFSDHFSFSEAGFAAVRFIEYLENPNRNHNNLDNLDNVRPAYLTRAAQTVLACATVLSEGLRPPENINLRPVGDGRRTLEWDAVPGAASYIVGLRRPGSLIYDQYFETAQSSVTWDGFTPDQWEALAISAKDPNGLMGPLSVEFSIEG
jgi:leucyl aminopeptidase